MFDFDHPVLLAALITGLGGVCAGFLLRELFLADRSTRWPEVRARIIWSAAISNVVGTTRMYQPAVRYEYEVKGSAYVGDRVSFGSVAAALVPREAEAWVSKYPVGRTVLVRVAPNHPSLSVIEPGAYFGLYGAVLASLGVLGWGVISLLRALGRA